MKQRESSGRRRFGIIAWMVAVAAPFALVGVSFAALMRAQQSALRDWLLSVLVLCPLVLCALPFYLLMLALGQVALPKAAAARRRRMRTLREGGLVLQSRVRDWSEKLPAPALEREPRQPLLFTDDEERDGPSAR